MLDLANRSAGDDSLRHVCICSSNACLLITHVCWFVVHFFLHNLHKNVSVTADSYNKAIRKVQASGIVTRVVAATQIHDTPFQVLAAPNGMIYFTDYTHRLYMFNPDNNETKSVSVEDRDVGFSGMAYHASKVYVIGEYVQYEDDAKDGKVYSFKPDLSAHTTVAQSVPAKFPRAIAFNKAGEAFIAAWDVGILKSAGISMLESWSLWSNGTADVGEGVTATTSKLHALSIAFDAAGNMVVGEKGCAVWLVSATTGKLKRLAGNSDHCGVALDPRNPAFSDMEVPQAVAVSPSGNAVYIADGRNHRILRLDRSCAAAGK